MLDLDRFPSYATEETNRRELETEANDERLLEEVLAVLADDMQDYLEGVLRQAERNEGLTSEDHSLTIKDIRDAAIVSLGGEVHDYR